MAQPFGVGDVVGGRYRITHHVVTSADQDIIFQAVDQVLNREVSVLLASRANAKQVATSAKELATGERASKVQVLDLGLSAERTYLISSVVNPNQLLDLVIPDSAPYVEPYFTDSLGSELFGQSREMQPQTYDDDAEYYARLQEDLANSLDTGRKLPGLPRRRPSFLDKVTADHAESEPDAPVATPDPQPFSLTTDLDVVEADPRADADDDVLEALYAWAPKVAGDSSDSKLWPAEGAPESAPAASGHAQPSTDSQDAVYEQTPSVPISTLAAGASGPLQRPATPAPADPDGEEVIDNPPAEPDPTFDPRHTANAQPSSSGALPAPPHTVGAVTPAESPGAQPQASSFTSLIKAVPPRTSSSFPAPHHVTQAQSPSQPSDATGPRPPLRWISAAVLIILVVVAAFILFNLLD